MAINMKTGIIGAVLIVAAVATIGVVTAKDAEGEWQAWLTDYQDAYSKKRTATLKIDDGVYLKSGQTAYLARREDGRVHYAWTLEALSAPGPTLTYDGKHAMFTADGKSVDLLAEKEPAKVANDENVDILAHEAQLSPGVTGLRAMVYNQNNPEAGKFTGFLFYPYDPKWVIEARFEPEAKFAPEDFQTSRGWWKRFYLAGHAVFEHDGQTVRLPMYAGEEDPAKAKELSAFFMDAMTGTETYGVGRYVDAEVDSFPTNTVKIDFNYTYNPACAYSPHFNCPVAETRLPFPLRAGAKMPAESPGH